MNTSILKTIAGFALLFILYHAAEYFVLFHYQPLFFLLLQVLFFIAAYLIARWQRFKGLQAWGLDLKKNWFANLAVGMGFGLLLYGVPFLFSLAIGSEKVMHIPALSHLLPAIGLFCFGNFFSSLSEDILTRGYLFKHFGSSMRPIFFIALSAVVYVLNHIYRLTEGFETSLYLFSLGLLFCLLLVITKRLWMTGGMHWIGNTTFYLTHNVFDTKTLKHALPPNTIFIIWIWIMMLLCILMFRSPIWRRHRQFT